MVAAGETSFACTGSAEKASDTSWGAVELAVLQRGPPQCAGADTFGVHARSLERGSGTVGREEVDMFRKGSAYRQNVSWSTRRCNGHVVPHPPVTCC